MNLEELWIGDYLLVKSIDKLGRFEGLDSTKLKVRIGAQVVLCEPSDCIQVEDPPTVELNALDTDYPKTVVLVDTTIDLHLDKLDGNSSVKPGEELSFQKRSCRNFVVTAIREKAPRIVIIHGHGEGVLRHEIYSILQSFPEVDRYGDWLSGAATEVWLNYES